MNDFDIRALLETLFRHEVQFLVIGGVAVQAHGHNRTTMDLDITLAVSQENWRRTAAALAELDAHVHGPNADSGLDATDPQTIGLGTPLTLTTKRGDLDVFPGLVPGGAPFEELLTRAVAVPFGSGTLQIVGLDDLISMKRASGRPRDIADIVALTDPAGDPD